MTAPEYEDALQPLRDALDALPYANSEMTVAQIKALLPDRPVRVEPTRQAVIEECIEAVYRVSYVRDYQRDELTEEYGKPSYDMAQEIIAALRALPGDQHG